MTTTKTAKKAAGKKAPRKATATKPDPVAVSEEPPSPAPSHRDPFERWGVPDLFTRWPSWFGAGWPERLAGELSDIRVEEFMDDHELVIRGELPGMDPENDIDISVDKGRLSIRATREEHTTSEDEGYRSEFRYGSFKRILTLPEGADADDVTATYTDGILEVRVPVADEGSGRRRIAISS